MAYDPQRKHQRRRVTEDDGPAAVDSLLGPGGNGSAANGSGGSGDEQPAPAAQAPAAVPDRTTDVTTDAPSGPDRRLVAIGFALVMLVVVLLARRRRRHDD